MTADEAKEEIYRNGFHVIENPELGSEFEKMLKDEVKLDFSSDTGFNFCLQFVLLNPQVKDILNALAIDFDSRYILAYCGGIPADQRNYSLRAGGKRPDIIIVHAWARGSSPTYYDTHDKPTTKYVTDTKLLRVLGADLRHNGSVGKELGCHGGDQRLPLADGGL
ncbi:hypothetical protein CEP54_014624 [Fusarium duplospermum]|uniref:Uncharacterized protein n=1 Tax=Fusarium duplospermum TaxID=1325734 RepID=A0A428NUU7_9HYPO|nr:hypothetical protein CEP54_014624 [Fusarium duplospermum]